MEKKLPVYTENDSVKKERKQNYLLELQKSYPNLNKLTENDYIKIKYELEQNQNKQILSELIEKSLYHIIKAVAEVYARYDIENVLPVEDGLACFIYEFGKKINEFETLPKNVAGYIHSVISYYAYLLIARAYNNELLIVEKLDVMAPKELEYKIDQMEHEEIPEHEIHKESLAKAFNKAGEKLLPREIDVLIMHLGLKTGKGMSFQEISKIYGITRGRVAQIFENALKKLRDKQDLLIDYRNIDMGL